MISLLLVTAVAPMFITGQGLPSWSLVGWVLLGGYLMAGGANAINNVVDVTNYVLLELGHPMHAFDFNRLEGKRIRVRCAQAGEKFMTLDEQERTLDDRMLLICDGLRGVALAGVMGGLNSEIHEDTTDLLLESAYFDPVNTRRTSRLLGLSTDSSRRFERGAVGECGLDYFRNYSPHAAQQRAFREQLELAVRLRKLVFLHQRDAHARFLALLREHAIGHGVAHCFTDGPAEAEAYLAHGLHLGITGWLCDERRGGALREAVAIAPRERLLVETDAPYLLPRDLPAALRGPRRVHRNEPRWLPHVVATLAAARGEDPRDVADYTSPNAMRLFGLAPRAGAAAT